MVFEVQAPQGSGWAGLGWSWVKIFTDEHELNTGKWHLPVYQGATRPDLTHLGGGELEKAPGVSICVRIGNPGDEISKEEGGSMTNIVEYIIPPYHKDSYNVEGLEGLQQKVSPQQSPTKKSESSFSKSPLRKPSGLPKDMPAPFYRPDIPEGIDIEELLTIDTRYKCRGLRFRFHYVMTNRNYEKVSLKVTLKNKSGAILVDTAYNPCEQQASGFPEKDYNKVKAGQL